MEFCDYCPNNEGNYAVLLTTPMKTPSILPILAFILFLTGCGKKSDNGRYEIRSLSWESYNYEFTYTSKHQDLVKFDTQTGRAWIWDSHLEKGKVVEKWDELKNFTGLNPSSAIYTCPPRTPPRPVRHPSIRILL